ncbi:hypothetical protein WJX74_006256 [Apatococcus lobatus]|uniref:AAA+ ATPase domain-containing protein n=1 Tax=Apatococcus lobatus TaxID=904363 RepID=A0AAW1SFY2_9CHLO
MTGSGKRALEAEFSRLRVNSEGPAAVSAQHSPIQQQPRPSSPTPALIPQLAGLKTEVAALRELIEWPLKYATEAQQLGVRWPRGLLLHGPPGCGKSLAVQAVAAELQADLREVSASSVFGAYIGQSEKKLREVFEAAMEQAKLPGVQPIVLFLDELDALCPQRDASRPHEARVVAQLLTLLDSIQADADVAARLSVVAATNRPHSIDAALRRPGRFDRELAVSTPGPEERASILQMHTAFAPLSPQVNLQRIAAACQGFSGADLAALAREAAMAAIADAAGPMLSGHRLGLRAQDAAAQSLPAGPMDAEAQGSITSNSAAASRTSSANICSGSVASSSDPHGPTGSAQNKGHQQTDCLNPSDPERPSGTHDIGAGTACSGRAADAAGLYASQQGAASLRDAACQEPSSAAASSSTASSGHSGAAAEPSHDLGGPHSSPAASLPSEADQGRGNVAAPLAQDAALRPISAADFEVAMQRIGPSITRDFTVELTPVSWKDIGGLEDVKQRLQQAIVWPLEHSDSFHRLGLSACRGVLLYGPPGCCKTTLARAAATASKATFLTLSGAQLWSMYVGEGEALLRATFRRARLAAPAILFLDEIDALAGKREGGAGNGSRGAGDVGTRLLSTLLTEMDGLEHATGVQVLAATNRPRAVDAALLRPGRLDTLLFVPPPDQQGRLQALRIHSHAMPLHPDVSLELLAEETRYFTGAELEGLCREAALSALREDLQGARQVAAKHFASVKHSMKPGLNPLSLQSYASFRRYSLQVRQLVMSEGLGRKSWLWRRELLDEGTWQRAWVVLDPAGCILTVFLNEAQDDCHSGSLLLADTSVQEVTLSRKFRTETQTHSQGILLRTLSPDVDRRAVWPRSLESERPRGETLISRSAAAPAPENRFRTRDFGTDFHEPAFFNQLVDLTDSSSDDSRSCHAALLGHAGVRELIKVLRDSRLKIQQGMNDSVSTPRESLAISRDAIIDLHALLKIMDGATSIQPSASDWGHGGLAGNNSDRWAWRRGQQWLRSFLDFIAGVERLMEGLLGLQPGPTRGDWYSKGHRLINALTQIEEGMVQGEFRELPSIKVVVAPCNLPAALQPPPPPPLPLHPVRSSLRVPGRGSSALSSDGSTDGTSQDDTPTLVNGSFKRRYCPLRSQLPYNAYWAKKIAI